ncbi:MAG: hypothetical protein KAK00_00520 [Nanoarchaeota archaeon]|nr:hypothetical protein [Nanoarchaeota archaeon]
MNMKYVIFITMLVMCSLVYGSPYLVDENMNMLENDVYNATNINSTNVNATTIYGTTIYQNNNIVLDSSNESSMNVNSSVYWGSYDTVSDLNNLILSHWDNITSKFITAVDEIYINMIGTTATLNETKLNESIRVIDTATNTSMATYVDGKFIGKTDNFVGDVSGTYDANIVADNSHLHDAENITNPPAACPSYSAITAFNTNFSSATCSDWWVDINGDTWTGSMDAGSNDITNIDDTNSTEFYQGTNKVLDVSSYIQSDKLRGTPVSCSAGYYMTTFEGANSTCVSAMRTTGENVTGNYNLSGILEIDDDDNKLRSKVYTIIDQNTDEYGLAIDSEATTSGKYALDISTGQGASALRILDGAYSSYYLGVPANGGVGGSTYSLRNLASADTNIPVMMVINDHAGDDQASLKNQNDGSGNNFECVNSGTGACLDAGTKDIINVDDINATEFYQGTNKVLDAASLSENSPYLTLANNVFGFVESYLNGTIDDRSISLETDPYWTANQSSYSTKTVADTLYAPINYGDDWNKTYADTLYRAESWDNLTGIPHATPSNGDVTHFSLADEIYDWVIGLGYSTTTGTVTSVATTAPISGGTITSTGTISLATATPSDGDTTHASTADHIWNWAVGRWLDSSKLRSTPAECSAGNYMTRYEGANSTCVAAVRTTGDTITGTVTIDQDTDAISLNIDSEATSNHLIFTTKTDANTGSCFWGQDDSATTITKLIGSKATSSGSNLFLRNLASANTTGPVVQIEQDNAGDDQNALNLQNDGSGNGIFVDGANGIGIKIDTEGNEPPIVLMTNATGVTCDAANEGGIYFDTTTNKHYGCDGTSWNAFY